MKNANLIAMFVCALFAASTSVQAAKPLKTAYTQLPAVKKGGTFYDVATMNPITLNPVLVHNVDDREIINWLFLPLMITDPDTYELVPGLAEKVEASRDNKEYTFTMRKDAKWTDGTPVTVDDVVFTFNKIMDPKVEAAPKRSFLGGVSVEKVDDTRVKFKVEVPKFNSRDFVASLQPIQKKQFENESDFNKSKENLRMIGSTAYKFKSLSRDQNVILERVPGWWGEKLPEFQAMYNFDQVHFRVIPDQTLSYERFLKGEIDALQLPGDKFVNQARGVDKDKVGTKPNSGKAVWADQFRSSGSLPWFGFAMNYKNPIFSKKTRQALAYLTDYDTIIQKAFYGLPKKSLSPFGSNGPNLDPALKQKSRQYSFDLKKANALLKEDGWADTDGDNLLDKTINGKKTPFRFAFNAAASSTAGIATGQIMKETLKKAGIELTVRPVENAALYKDFDEGNFDSVFMGWGGGSIYPDPRQIWHSQSAGGKGSNSIGYSNPQVDALIEKANLEFDTKKRTKMLQEIGKILYEDVPYIFLVERDYVIVGLNSRVKSPKWMFKYGNMVAKEIFYQ